MPTRGDHTRRQEGRFRLAPYQPSWADDFEQERRRLFALPGCPFLDIEHIGSTSVPGLDAKPIIDMMASVRRLEGLEPFRSSLDALGYTNLDGGFQFRKSFARPASGKIDGYHLHVVAEEVWEQKDERLFCAWLREHPDVALEYTGLKSALLSKHPDSMADYTMAKSDFIRKVVNDARRAQGLPIRTDWTE